jgi:site-specific recombinase XerD
LSAFEYRGSSMNSFLTSNLRLVKAHLRIDSVVPYQPLIFQCWKDRIDLFQEPTIFLHEKFVKVGGKRSKHTWEAGGYDLLTWLQWCQLNKINWRDATESDRQQFVDDYEAASRDPRSINRKISTVKLFYEFCSDEHWYHRDIGTSIEERKDPNRPIDDDALAHIRAPSGRAKEKDTLLRKVGRKDVVRPLQAKQLKKVLEHVGPTYGDDDFLERPKRDRLICDLAYVAGARLSDVLKMTTLKFLSLDVEPHELLTEFPLIVENGKHGVTRQVAAPGWLVLAIQAYIRTERAESERKGKRRGKRITTALFLGHANSKSAGKAISPDAIQNMFASTCMACGITEKKEVKDEETGQTYLKVVPAHSFHDLRRTCAVLTYHAEKNNGNPEPWKIVQIKLGHKSLKETTDTYLSHVSIFGEKNGITDIRRLIGLAS